MTLDFFHLIADPDSAEVRRFLVDYEMTDRVNFRNVAYETHESALRELTGELKVPVLALGNGSFVSGKQQVIAWLQAHPKI